MAMSATAAVAITSQTLGMATFTAATLPAVFEKYDSMLFPAGGHLDQSNAHLLVIIQTLEDYDHLLTFDEKTVLNTVYLKIMQQMNNVIALEIAQRNIEKYLMITKIKAIFKVRSAAGKMLKNAKNGQVMAERASSKHRTRILLEKGRQMVAAAAVGASSTHPGASPYLATQYPYDLTNSQLSLLFRIPSDPNDPQSPIAENAKRVQPGARAESIAEPLLATGAGRDDDEGDDTEDIALVRMEGLNLNAWETDTMNSLMPEPLHHD
ncbi:hypothetical protein B0H17DRAFT_1337788 [Mycena rosella]|uniref:Uncharacterized protein n=1 Tax=Mycena rosella TaxID=1033263 RepID=A0AAD7CR10_MYCRO|nr:hypothetical protein B0H17DRAFT_1337788 [Mycena rosella]